MKHAWHALFAALPHDAVVNRKAVGSGEAIAGWQSLTVELSAGPAGLRHVMVTLDVGGRLEADGSFRGTRWRSVTLGAPRTLRQSRRSSASS